MESWWSSSASGVTGAAKPGGALPVPGTAGQLTRAGGPVARPGETGGAVASGSSFAQEIRRAMDALDLAGLAGAGAAQNPGLSEPMLPPALPQAGGLQNAVRPGGVRATGAAGAGGDAALMEASRQLEAAFFRLLWQAMRATVPDGGLLPKGLADDIWRDMLDAAYSDTMAERGGLGLARLVYDELSGRRGSGAPPAAGRETAGR